MISEEEIDDIIARARALGTDFAVFSDIIWLIMEVRLLQATVEAAKRLNAERLRFEEINGLAAQQRDKITESETALDIALKNALVKLTSKSICNPHGWL